MIQLLIKLIFVAGTPLKSPEQPIFAKKTVFLEFLKLYFVFFHETLHTDAKWQYLKYDGARFSKNIFIPAQSGKKLNFAPDVF